MKLHSINMSQITSLFQVGQTEGDLYLPELLQKLSERYEFADAPTTYQNWTGEMITFRFGKFMHMGIESLELFNDGLVIRSKSDTDYIDQFFQDLISFVKEVGLTIIKTHTINQIYNSSLIIEADPKILKPLEILNSITRVLETDLKEISGLDVSYEAFGWTLAADQTKNPFLKPAPFSLERRVGAEYSLNMFATSAPLRTKQHIKILNELEEMF